MIPFDDENDPFWEDYMEDIELPELFNDAAPPRGWGEPNPTDYEELLTAGKRDARTLALPKAPPGRRTS